METSIVVDQFQSKTPVRLSYHPVGECPHCGTSFNGEIAQALLVPWGCEEKLRLVVNHFCHACGCVFTVVYSAPDAPYDMQGFRPVLIWPRYTQSVMIENDIQTLSPEFCKIYSQAVDAEGYGLDRVCGIAYRKALEFLVKDYAVHRNPGEADTIKAMPLAQVIGSYIDNQRIKVLAKKSAWIGNDETHYVRKHEDRSVEDLKKFLRAMLTFISAELAVDDAMTIT